MSLFVAACVVVYPILIGLTAWTGWLFVDFVRNPELAMTHYNPPLPIPPPPPRMRWPRGMEPPTKSTCAYCGVASDAAGRCQGCGAPSERGTVT